MSLWIGKTDCSLPVYRPIAIPKRYIERSVSNFSSSQQCGVRVVVLMSVALSAVRPVDDMLALLLEGSPRSQSHWAVRLGRLCRMRGHPLAPLVSPSWLCANSFGYGL